MKKRTDNKPSRKWLWPTIIIASVVILGIAAGVIMWSINKAQEEKESGIQKDRVVMIVTTRGGMCNGPCNHPRYSLYEDGKFDGHMNLTRSEVTTIKRIASKTSFGATTAPEQDGQCDSYVDGQDTVLIFPTIHGDRQFVPCEMLSDKDYDTSSYRDMTYILGLIVPENESLNFDRGPGSVPSIIY